MGMGNHIQNVIERRAMPRIDIPSDLVLWETDAAYERRAREHRGPYELDRCFLCDRPIGSGVRCLGMRIDNPTGLVQIVGGEPEGRPDGAHFDIHVGIECLKKYIKARASLEAQSPTGLSPEIVLTGSK